MIDEVEFQEMVNIFGLGEGPANIIGVLGAGNVLTFALRAGYTATGQQWTRTTGGVTSDISGQTATTYTQLPSDRGSIIGCRAIGLTYSGSAGVVPVTPPLSPTITGITAGNGSVTATITDNADNGGAAVTDHRLYVYRTANDELLAQANGASPLTVSGLPNGTQVYAQAASINGVGIGGKSAKSANVTPAIAIPAPVATAAPTINSSPKVFELMDATPGTFTGADSVITGVFSNGSQVGTLPYLVMPSDVNKVFTLTSVGTNGGGSTPAATAAGTNCPPVLSGAKRVTIASGRGAVGANNFRTARCSEGSNVDLTDLFVENGAFYVDAAEQGASQEKPVGNPVTYTTKLLIGTTGAGANQSGATLVEITNFKAAAGQLGYLWKLDGSPASAADFIAGGGTISGDGKTIKCPDGFKYASDRAIGSVLPKNTRYLIVQEITVPVGAYIPTGTILQGLVGLGDMIKDGSTAGLYVGLKDWSAINPTTGQVSNTVCNVYGTGAFGKKLVSLDGDSIAAANSDRNPPPNGLLTGDADGALAFASRALNAGGYSWTRAAVSGANARAPALYGGFNQRALQGRFADASITNMIANNASLPWAGAAGVGLQATQRDHWAKIRAWRKAPNLPLIATTRTPGATSTDNFATTANQTATLGPGITDYNPFLRAKVYTAADPTGFFDIYQRIYDGAAAAGFNDVVDTKIPCNGTAQAGYFDTTHPQAIIHAYVAGYLAAELPALLGF